MLTNNFCFTASPVYNLTLAEGNELTTVGYRYSQENADGGAVESTAMFCFSEDRRNAYGQMEAVNKFTILLDDDTGYVVGYFNFTS